MRNKKIFILSLLVSCAFLGGCFEEETAQKDEKAKQVSVAQKVLSAIKTGPVDSQEAEIVDPLAVPNISGQYLASQFAQNRHDWKTAAAHLNDVLKATPDEPNLLKMSMILSAGSGDVEEALRVASQLRETPDGGSLASLFEAVGLIKAGDMKKAADFIATMPRSGLAEFIHPLYEGWAQAGLGVYDVDHLQSNTVHLKHAVLIADYLKKADKIEALLDQSLSAQNISVGETEVIADGYAHIGQNEKATVLYEEIYKQLPQNKVILEKIEGLKAGKPVDAFKSVKSPQDGVALAMGDMARLLFQEGSDDSARIFAHLALYLDKDNQYPLILLGAIAEQNERYEQASEYYSMVKDDNENYLEVRRRAAEMLDKLGKTEEAIHQLRELYKNSDDTQALIVIGDLHRQKEQFAEAVKVYNEAEKHIHKNAGAGEMPPEYWNLLYVRGMANERAGNWVEAENDLTKALDYQPNNPFVLNYLGYAWADQDKNLDKALEMIKRAVELQPQDGYITDSLGWVYFKMGRFAEGVPYLEKAVELLPYDPVINDHLGDAYWRVGRKLEARFQWERAKNHSEDQQLIGQIDAKMIDGLPAFEAIKHADADPAAEKL